MIHRGPIWLRNNKSALIFGTNMRVSFHFWSMLNMSPKIAKSVHLDERLKYDARINLFGKKRLTLLVYKRVMRDASLTYRCAVITHGALLTYPCAAKIPCHRPHPRGHLHCMTFSTSITTRSIPPMKIGRAF
jgi:hypothetical protein